MENIEKIIELTERTVHKYNQWEKKKRDYGTGELLSRSEIHTIAAIGNYGNLNVTQLGDHLGITKGAASQMVYKLVDRNYVIKATSPHSDTEVVLTLTDSGEKAYKGHEAYHQKGSGKLADIIKDADPKVTETIIQYMEVFERILDEELRK